MKYIYKRLLCLTYFLRNKILYFIKPITKQLPIFSVTYLKEIVIFLKRAKKGKISFCIIKV